MKYVLVMFVSAVTAQDITLSVDKGKITVSSKLNLKDGTVINIVISKKSYSIEPADKGFRFVESEHEVARDSAEVTGGRFRYSLSGASLGSYKVSLNYLKELQVIPDPGGENFSISKSTYTIQGVDGAKALLSATRKDAAEIKKILDELHAASLREYKSIREIENVILGLEEKAAKLAKSAILYGTASYLQGLLFDVRNSTLMGVGKKEYLKNAKESGVSNDTEDMKEASESATGNDRLKMPLDSSKVEVVEKLIKHETILLVTDHLLAELGKESTVFQPIIKVYDSEESLRFLTSKIKDQDSKKAYAIVDEARVSSLIVK